MEMNEMTVMNEMNETKDDFTRNLHEWLASQGTDRDEEIFSALYFETEYRQILRDLCQEIIEKARERQEHDEALQTALNQSQRDSAAALKEQKEAEKQLDEIRQENLQLKQKQNGYEKQLARLQQELAEKNNRIKELEIPLLSRVYRKLHH